MVFFFWVPLEWNAMRYIWYGDITSSYSVNCLTHLGCANIVWYVYDYSIVHVVTS